MKLTFLHISDTHISGDPDYQQPSMPDYVAHPNRGAESLVQAIKALPFAFDFIIHTGDVCADPHEADYHCARDLLLQLPAPVYLLPGNHDSADLMGTILHDGQRLHVLRDDHLKLGGIHLVTVDTAWQGNVHAPTLREDQILGLAETLEATGDQPIIVAMHHSPVETGVPWLDDHMRVQNGDRVQRLLHANKDRLAGVFHGHIHQQATSQRDGVLYFCCQSTWSNLHGYPGLQDGITDPLTLGGFNLVMLRRRRTFVRRYNLPPIAP